MKYSFTRDNDWLLIITTLLLCIFGLVMVYSASYVWAFDHGNSFSHFFLRQLMWFVLTLLIFFVVMHFPYKYYRKFSVAIIFVSIIALLLVHVPGLGAEVYGAKRWIRIGPLTIQPSEFVKVGIIIYLAHVYSKKQSYINDFVKGVMPPLVIVGIVFSLIMLQPDLGTATSILLVTGLLVFFSGAKMRHLIGLGTVGGTIFIILATSQEYRLQRLTSFLDPFAYASETGYQLVQSYIAIAHGGLTGAGLGQSIQKLLYLPEPHTDFILAIIAEELGIFGVGFVFLCFSIIFFRGVMIGTRCKSVFGSLLAFGIVFQVGVQVIFNVGAVTGLLPITGIPLPFLSYGGSSLMVSLLSIAILANISKYNIRQRHAANEEQTVSA
ncbi:putative lipid II flippase FtsW [Desertibacillus haloalkaliphilus]|uniref:putative lipid II flippase FtsW n=1 Tax=Desertibacillus haloalkaliphilus TaxID=1328930 RepID=UPI001C2788F6|nr:putative lipid II flippase FtsW [Desertibacillus haloalkaliphilus]MBU8905267.1 putative lipid II flippase FtsW [Desertibacillus haloalkaliphilus]